MNKIKTMLVLAVCIMLSSCSNNDYVSKRHPEGEKVEVTDSALEESPSTNEDNTNTDNTDTTNEDTNDENSIDEELKEDGVIYTVEDVVNMRLAPSPDSSIITTVSPGEELIKLGDSDDWSRVTVNGQTGYIRSDLLIKE